MPGSLVEPLIREYEGALDAGRAGNWELAGLKAGKLCEIIYTILNGHVDGAYPDKPSKPRNMVTACTALESADPARFSRSVRIQIPRMLIAIYELRNNRDIGHVGGDVDPNQMDGELFIRSIKWLIAELIRIFHNISIGDARRLVEIVSLRSIPKVWEGNGRVRILDTKMKPRDRVLLILYHRRGPVPRQALLDDVEYSNPSVFTRSVLRDLHKNKLIEFDRSSDHVTLLPPGIAKVETELLK